MAIPPEIEAAIAARVTAMEDQERYDRAAAMIDFPEPHEEDNLEFVKLILGPRASVRDFIKMLASANAPPDDNDTGEAP